jgi:hypothetical protein
MFLNAIPISTYTSGTVTLYNGGTLVTDLSSIAISVTKGSSASLLLQVQRYNSTDSSGVAGCTSGTRVDLKLHTAAGREYPVQVKLP